MNRRFISFFTSLLLTCSTCTHLHATLIHAKGHKQENQDQQLNLDAYLLPQNHPLSSYLKSLFHRSNMFKSAEHFKQAGFKIKHGHAKLMVGAHPLFPQYLFKKFPDRRSQLSQLENFIKRIEGAKTLRNYIEKHQFKHIAVPQKWLYKLPKSFSKNSDERSYVLIVEKMDILDDWKDLNGAGRQFYYNMDREVLTEFCTLLHAVGGCDAFPRNQPGTRSGQIAFVDTEHVGKMPGHFLKHIVPELNKELQAYAVALWMQLEAEKNDRLLNGL